ncbi:MAG: type II toxin-antitoxin system PemK/MazF family toxin [Deltaproteobacteria bacterium]|nr:type II toxin-antitoxin system PemK/MazF family toxin [Deltaproteobacteria bacterium]
MNAFPWRGEVWLVNWNPARSSEQAGKRPALTIQNDIGLEKKGGWWTRKKWPRWIAPSDQTGRFNSPLIQEKGYERIQAG